MAKFTAPITRIENWQVLASNAPIDGIVSLFETTGNSFPLTLNTTLKASERLHIYFTLDGSEKINFYVIPATEDVKGNKNIYNDGLFPVPLNSKQETINNSENNELVTWINNWCNETMRNNWLMKITNAPQVLVIHTSDFTVNDLHKCYLALRPNTNPSIHNKYRMDLVVQNTVTGAFINKKLVSDVTGIGPQFRDMARPVPPFGQEGHASTDQTNFGILSTLGIQ